MTETLKNYPYQDASLAIDQRVDDLLGRMTLAEKAAQMTCIWQKKADLLLDESGARSTLRRLAQTSDTDVG